MSRRWVCSCVCANVLAWGCGDGTATTHEPEPLSLAEQSELGASPIAAIDCGLGWPEHARWFEVRAVALVNQYRASGAQCGEKFAAPVPALTVNQVLTCVARAHSLDLAQRGVLEHEDLEGNDAFVRLRAAGYDWGAAAENLGRGQSSPDAVVATWLAEPAHCENMMSPDYRDVGIGYHAGAANTHLWTQLVASSH